VAAVMVGAIATVHLANGFFMNWAGTQKGEGFEYHLLVFALAIPLIVNAITAAVLLGQYRDTQCGLKGFGSATVRRNRRRRPSPGWWPT
jgi:hypothetical protein